MKTLDFYNAWHLGDCLYTIHYFNKLSLAYPEITIHFYCNPNYHSELAEWIQYSNINLHNISDVPTDAINTWIGENDFYWKNLTPAFDNQFDHFYIAYFDLLSMKAKVSNPIETKYDMLFDNQEIITGASKEFDYFIINSQGMSGQTDQEAVNNLNKFTLEQLKDFRVITTEKIPNSYIPCTRDEYPSLMNIAQLSCHATNIVGIHTAPYLPCFNVFNIDAVRNWIIIQRQGLTYSFNNRIFNIKDSKELF